MGFFGKGFFSLSQGFCYRQEAADVSGQHVPPRCLRDAAWSSPGRGRPPPSAYHFSGCCLLAAEGNYRAASLRTGLRMCLSQGWWPGWGSRASGAVSCSLRCELLGLPAGPPFAAPRRLAGSSPAVWPLDLTPWSSMDFVSSLSSASAAPPSQRAFGSPANTLWRAVFSCDPGTLSSSLPPFLCFLRFLIQSVWSGV